MPVKTIDCLKAAAEKLKTEIAVLGVVYRDSRTPWYAKALIAVVIAYSLSPIDLIPDFIPVLGYLDDLILIPLGITLAIKLVPEEIFKEAHEKVADNPESTGISGWWFGGLIILFWICVIGLIAWFVWNRMT
jgi:uncharacterized membrane protein YkvA (DUF1232 family)